MDREKSIVKVSIVGIVVNLVLVAFKAFVGFVTGSIAVILDAVNNLSDALSSVITIIGAKLAGRAPDKEHPYGHGKIQALVTLFIAFMLLGVAWQLGVRAVDAFRAGPTEPPGRAAFLLALAAVVAKELLFRGTVRVARGASRERTVMP